MKFEKTYIGKPDTAFQVIRKVSELPRIKFSRDELEDRVLKYTLVTATNRGYMVINHDIVNFERTSMLGISKPIYKKTAAWGNLLKKKEEKDCFINELCNRDRKFCEKIIGVADGYINDIRGMVAEYVDYIKRYPCEKNDMALKEHNARLRGEYNKALEREKSELIRELRDSIKSWGHRFLIENLEYFFSNGILIGRYPLCQIPIKEEKDSPISGLQGMLSFIDNKVVYDDLGFNLTTFMKHIVDAESFKRNLNDTNSIIDLSIKEHQLTLLFLGKSIPLEGDDKDDKRILNNLNKRKERLPQYYLALELPVKR